MNFQPGSLSVLASQTSQNAGQLALAEPLFSLSFLVQAGRKRHTACIQLLLPSKDHPPLKGLFKGKGTITPTITEKVAWTSMFQMWNLRPDG